jgi:hypothetical protein
VDGFTSPELVVESCLRRGLQLIAADPGVLDPALKRYKPEALTEIHDFFVATPIPVVDGWPTLNTQIPCVTVMLRPESEDAGRTPIGLLAQETVGNEMISSYAHIFGATVECAVYGNSQREVSLIATAVKWLLLHSRRALEYDGLIEQTLVVTDYEPVPSLFDENTYWFIRTVSLNCATVDVIEIATGDLFTELDLTVASLQSGLPVPVTQEIPD